MTGMAEAMANNGHKVLVLADGKIPDTDSKLNYDIKRFSGWKPLRRLRKANYLEKICKNNQVDAIYADSWKSIEYVTKKKKKILVLAHGTEIPKQYWTLMLDLLRFKKNRIKNSYNDVFKIIANSSYTKDLMQASLKIKSEMIDVIHPGIDVYKEFISNDDKKRVESMISHRSPIITTLARVEERKGHKYVIKAIDELRSTFPNIIYLIAGEGPFLSEIKRYTKKLNLEDNVSFIGWITEPEKSLILKNSHIFIMTPTLIGESVEGFGMAYIDAAFHGIPAIGTKTGGVSDAIVHDQTGLLCEPNNQEQITKSIHKLLSNDSLRKELGNNGRERAYNLFAWENKIKEYLHATK